MKRFFTIVALCASGCSNSVSDAELVGVYVAAYRGDSAMVSLNADRTYSNVIRLKDGLTRNSGGAWKASSLGSYTVVEFSNFDVIPAYKETQKVQWATEVERAWLGQPRLCFDSDVAYCYTKQAGP
jgi:hypothetical protein